MICIKKGLPLQRYRHQTYNKRIPVLGVGFYERIMSKRKSKKENKAAQRAAAAARDTNRARTQVPGGSTKRARVPGGDKRPAPAGPKRELTFGKQTYLFMGIGFALVLLGLLLMSGGRGTDYTEFDIDKIYGFRQITLAPILMLSGLGVVIYGILKK